MVASGKLTITVARGRQSSTISRRAQSAALPSRYLIQTLSMSSVARAFSARTYQSAMGFTDQRMRERPGPTWACAMANRFHRLPSIRATRTPYSWRSPVILMDRMKNAASFVQPTGASHLRKFSIGTKTLAARMCFLILQIQALRTPRFGKRARAPGKTAHGTEQAGEYSNQQTAGRPGDS